MVFVHRAETVPFYRSRYELYLEQRGVFTRLAGPSTTPPGGAAPLRDFQSAKLLLDGVTFLARDTTGRQALYSWRRGVLRTLVDEQSLGERVASFWMAALGDRVALLNIPTSSSASVQLVDGDGAVTELVRIGDVAPGGNTVTRLSGLAASDEMLVISAETNAGGALLGWDDAAGMGVVVDQSTMLPGLARPYEPARLFQGSSSLFSVSGRSVAFVQNRFVPGAMPECVGGVFLWESGSVRQVAGNRDRNPETNQELKCFYSAFLGAQGLWFRATTVSISSGPGISLPTYGDLLTRRGPKLLRVFGLDRLGDERVYTYRPVMDEDRAVLLLGIDRPSSARARYGLRDRSRGRRNCCPVPFASWNCVPCGCARGGCLAPPLASMRAVSASRARSAATERIHTAWTPAAPTLRPPRWRTQGSCRWRGAPSLRARQALHRRWLRWRSRIRSLRRAPAPG